MPLKISKSRKYMEMAMELATKCVSESTVGSPKPKVGAVIVRDDKVLGTAYRGELVPGDHAEYTLLERKLANEDLTGTTLFTTLEPCTQRNEPKIPCSTRVIQRKIKKVYIGILDPNILIRGEGQIRLQEAGIETALFDSNLMKQIRADNAEFWDWHRASLKNRTKAEMQEPVEEGLVGPNGYRIAFLKNGDKVEWIPTDDGSGEEFPLLLRRNDSQILQLYNEFWDKVWWNRHQYLLNRIEQGEKIHMPNSAFEAAKRIEDAYGIDNLIMDEVDWGILQGRMSALAWVMGAEWEESLDT